MPDPFPHALDRLRLRGLRASDLDAFHAYRSVPAVARYQGWAPMTRQQAADFLHAHAGRAAFVPGAWRQLAIAERSSDRLLGDAGVWLSDDGVRAEFGLSIAPGEQGRGYGTECVRGLIALLFASTAIAEVRASADLRNAACLAVLARAGMRPLATRRATYKGEACTERVFSASRSADGPPR